MIRNIYHKPRIDWIIIFMLACIVVIFMTSCEMFKHTTKHEASSGSSSVMTASGIDTSQEGSVTKTNSNIKESNQWQRETWQFPRDTNVTNIYPTTYIRETGSGSKETNTQTVDSNWLKAYIAFALSQKDTTHAEATTNETTKESETKGLGVWLLVVCFGAYWLLTKALPWVAKRVKFVKPV